MMTLLDHALHQIDLGFAVFPLLPYDKHPATAHGFKDATRDPDYIRYWWQKNTKYNIGIATGETSGCWVLDVDNKDGGEGYASLRSMQGLHGAIGSGYMVSTATSGLHVYYRWGDREVRNSTGKVAPGIDVRGNGGYVVAAGSVRTCGEYVAVADGEMDEAPDWLTELAAPMREVQPRRPAPSLDLRGEGEKAHNLLERLAAWRQDDYDAWVRVGMALHGLGAEGLALWDAWSRQSQKYKPGECERKWKSFANTQITLGSLVYMAQQDTPRRTPYRTDYANIIANGL